MVRTLSFKKRVGHHTFLGLHLGRDTNQYGHYALDVHRRVEEGIKAFIWVFDPLGWNRLSAAKPQNLGLGLLENVWLAESQKNYWDDWKEEVQDLDVEVFLNQLKLLISSKFFLFIDEILILSGIVFQLSVNKHIEEQDKVKDVSHKDFLLQVRFLALEPKADQDAQSQEKGCSKDCFKQVSVERKEPIIVIEAKQKFRFRVEMNLVSSDTQVNNEDQPNGNVVLELTLRPGVEWVAHDQVEVQNKCRIDQDVDNLNNNQLNLPDIPHFSLDPILSRLPWVWHEKTLSQETWELKVAPAILHSHPVDVSCPSQERGSNQLVGMLSKLLVEHKEETKHHWRQRKDEKQHIRVSYT